MNVAEIRQYPVKSMLGELVPAVDIGDQGVVGDRLCAVRDPDGKLGSGKNTRRFRRMPGLFQFQAYAAEPAPIVQLPDGRHFAADDPAGHRTIGEVLGRTVTLVPENVIPHHDEGPVSLMTTAALSTLSELSGTDVDRLRFRTTLLVDGSARDNGFPEDDWVGHRLEVGDAVRW